mgnify:CR=1 FL=1
MQIRFIRIRHQTLHGAELKGLGNKSFFVFKTSSKFIYIFKLNDGIKQWKMLEISDIPWDSPIYKNFLETTKMKSFIEYLRIED